MHQDGKGLTQPKDTKQQQRRLALVTFEALLNNVRFEWQDDGNDKAEAERNLKDYLSKHTNGYEIVAFYLKNSDPWA